MTTICYCFVQGSPIGDIGYMRPTKSIVVDPFHVKLFLLSTKGLMKVGGGGGLFEFAGSVPCHLV